MTATARSGHWSPSSRSDKFNSLLVPHDLTSVADRVLPTVGSLARRGHLGVRLLTTASVGLEENDLAELADHGRQIHGCPVTPVVVDAGDDPSADIANYAGSHPGALLCLATHGHTALGELIIGSMTDDLLRRHVGPMVVAGPRIEPNQPLGQNIIACVAPDSAPGPLMDAVEAWRTTFGGTVEVFEAVHGDLSKDPELTPELQTAHERLPDSAVTLVDARDPSSAILAAANDSGSVVALGTHARRGLERAVLGSVAWEVIRFSSTPVLVVPTPHV